MKKFAEHWFSWMIIGFWVILFLLSRRFELISMFGNKGSHLLESEYYRYVTSLFLHSNALHVLWNALALYFVCYYLEPQINPWKLCIFSISIGTLTECMISLVYKNAFNFGGSPIVFALIGLILAMRISRIDCVEFRLGTWYGNWTLAYAVLANLPIYSSSVVSSLLIHGIAFILGIVVGCIALAMKLI